MKKQYNTPEVFMRDFSNDVIVMSVHTFDNGDKGVFDDYDII